MSRFAPWPLVVLATLLLAACLPFGLPSPENPAPAVTQLTEVTPPSATSPEQQDPAPTPAVKSPSGIACEKSGGRMVQVGGASLLTCQRPTRDAGKSCRRQGDCVGECLARSETCAPVAPLFGCNEVLQKDGRKVTLCID